MLNSEGMHPCVSVHHSGKFFLQMFLVISEEWHMWAGELDGWERWACGSPPNSAGVSSDITCCVDRRVYECLG